jgi:hypothetical protein
MGPTTKVAAVEARNIGCDELAFRNVEIGRAAKNLLMEGSKQTARIAIYRQGMADARISREGRKDLGLMHGTNLS